MKKLAMVILVAVMFVPMISSAEFQDPPNLGKAASPPPGAIVDFVPEGGQVFVVVRGIEVFNNAVAIYGGDTIEPCTLIDGRCAIPGKNKWANLPFKGQDGAWHYLLISPEHAVMPAEWMGPGVAVMPNFGQGCSMTYKGWLKKQ